MLLRVGILETVNPLVASSNLASGDLAPCLEGLSYLIKLGELVTLIYTTEVDKKIKSLEIAFSLIEFSYRIQQLKIEELQELFATELQVKAIVLPIKNLNPREIKALLFNNIHSSICSFWITIDEAFDKIFGKKQPENYSFRSSFRTIIYMYRCAFSHEISEPKWYIKDQYRKKYELVVPDECRETGIARFEYDFKTLHLQNVEIASFKGLAGLKILFNIACKLLKDQNQL